MKSLIERYLKTDVTHVMSQFYPGPGHKQVSWDAMNLRLLDEVHFIENVMTLSGTGIESLKFNQFRDLYRQIVKFATFVLDIY